MKREEKNLQSRQRILTAALKEFGAKSFAEASMNAICSQGEISKGIIYHYFADKDELFLACVRACMEALTAYMGDHVQAGNEGIEAGLEQYFQARLTFFDQNPLYLNLFCTGILAPPRHLEESVAAAREDFNELNVHVFKNLLQCVPLRDGISVDAVISLFRMYQDYTGHGQGESIDIRKHQRTQAAVLNILLYGAIEKGDNHD